MVGALTGAGSAIGAAGTVSAVGFTSTGVAAGSIAAGIQSSIGPVAAGSLFSTLQSIGATSALCSGPVVGGAALLGVGIACAYNYFKKNEPEKKEEE